MTMADDPPLKKFMFERSFDFAAASATPKEREKKPVLMKPEQIDALKHEAYQQGYAAGHQAGVDAQVADHMRLLTRVEGQIAELSSHLDRLARTEDEKTRTLIPAILRRLMPELAKQHGFGEIEGLVTLALKDMRHEKRLVIRLNDTDVQHLNDRIQAMTEAAAFTGTVVVLPDTTIACGDCRIEWAEGGMERHTESNLSTVTNLMTGA